MTFLFICGIKKTFIENQSNRLFLIATKFILGSILYPNTTASIILTDT